MLLMFVLVNNFENIPTHFSIKYLYFNRSLACFEMIMTQTCHEINCFLVYVYNRIRHKNIQLQDITMYKRFYHLHFRFNSNMGLTVIYIFCLRATFVIIISRGTCAPHVFMYIDLQVLNPFMLYIILVAQDMGN